MLKGFVIVLVPAALGGALWEALGLPLGWLMGAAVVTGGFAMTGTEVAVPKPLYNLSLATLGASVGLAVTPDVAAALFVWAPAMIVAAGIGILAAAFISPFLARFGRMERSTAFFSLLPGGVIEMANIGENYGADRVIVAAIHAVRVGLVVGLLPLLLVMFSAAPSAEVLDVPNTALTQLAGALAVGLLGGWLGAKAGVPAAWLLGALIFVAVISSLGGLTGRVPEPLLAAVQVMVGIGLGARFQRSRFAAVPRALAAGFPLILAIMGIMALAAGAASLVMPFALPTLILCFSIGGMAEMVLTSKVLGQNVALVAGFQAVRGVLVNTLAGAVWRRLAPSPNMSDHPKG